MKSLKIILFIFSLLFYFSYRSFCFQVIGKNITYEIDMKSNICFVKEILKYKLAIQDIKEDFKKNQIIFLKKTFPHLHINKDFFENKKKDNSKDVNFPSFYKKNNDSDNINMTSNEKLNSNNIIYENLNITVDFSDFNSDSFNLSNKNYYIKSISLQNKLINKDDKEKNLKKENLLFEEISSQKKKKNVSLLSNSTDEMIEYTNDLDNKDFDYIQYLNQERNFKIYDLEIIYENQKDILSENRIISVIYEYEINNFLIKNYENKKNDFININKNSFSNENMQINLQKGNSDKDNINLASSQSNINQYFFQNKFPFIKASIFSYIFIINEHYLENSEIKENLKEKNQIIGFPLGEIKIFIDDYTKELNYGDIYLPDFIDFDLHEGFYSSNMEHDKIVDNQNFQKNQSHINSVIVDKNLRNYMIYIDGKKLTKYIEKEIIQYENKMMTNKNGIYFLQRLLFLS